MARQQHSPEEKSRLVLEAIRGERTINEIAAENNIHPNVIQQIKNGFDSYFILGYLRDTFFRRSFYFMSFGQIIY